MSENKQKITQTIELTKEQFKALLKLIYLGNWMANANRDGSAEDPHKKEYEAMEDYIFLSRKSSGLTNGLMMKTPRKENSFRRDSLKKKRMCGNL